MYIGFIIIKYARNDKAGEYFIINQWLNEYSKLISLTICIKAW